MREEIFNLNQEVIDIRRNLHQIPELAYEEYKTSGFIVKKLEQYGIDVYKNIAKTGVVGFLKVKDAKNTIAFRADMDALNVEEKTDLDFKSIHKGNMHACGHDGHMTILLGFAKFLSENSERLKENIAFIFQPAEEGPGGAEPMIEEGIIEKFNIKQIMGLHVFPELQQGKIGCKKGPMMAQAGEFDISINGKGAHGARPHEGNDAIIIMSNIISTYQTIISRNIDPIEGGVLTIGKVWAGERRNIIAQEASLEGTIRVFNEDVYNKIKNRMVEIAKGMEKTYNCTIDIVFRDMYPAVVNDDDLVDQLVEVVGGENVEWIKPQMISEDFSYFQRKIPGLFFFLGTRNEEKGYVNSLHNSKFTFDEKILLVGIQIYLDMLKKIGAYVW
ncbi:amidohydrolase [Lutibacter sp. B2]|nr:amidohydrolase [Lutibacter sp. B2]